MFEGFANVWTPAITAKELGKRPVQVRIAGENLVFGKDDGESSRQNDRSRDPLIIPSSC